MRRIWTRMVFVFLAFFSAPALLLSSAQAGEIGFLEQFSLSSDRQKELSTLLPGTRDYYYYHALHYQNIGQYDQADQVLMTWQQRYRYDSRRNRLKRRQALLRYEKFPAVTLDYLRKKLYLRFQHSRKVRGKKRKRPSKLDPNAISRATLTKRALQYSTYSLYGFETRALEWLAKAQKGQLSARHRRKLLQRLQRPDVPGILDLINADLDAKYSSGFGS